MRVFSGFVQDRDGVYDRTYSICKFPLNESESMLESINGISAKLEQESINAMKEWEGLMDVVERLVEDLSGIGQGMSDVCVDEVHREGAMDRHEETLRQMTETVDGPVTRRRGRVKEYDLVMSKAL